MLETFLVVVFFLPMVALGKMFKSARGYCRKKNWIFLEEVVWVVGFPFKVYDDIF